MTSVILLLLLVWLLVLQRKQRNRASLKTTENNASPERFFFSPPNSERQAPAPRDLSPYQSLTEVPSRFERIVQCRAEREDGSLVTIYRLPVTQNVVDTALPKPYIVSHRNLLSVERVGLVNQEFFLVEEHCDGINLAELFARLQNQGAKLPYRLACLIGAYLGAGLSHLEQHQPEVTRDLLLRPAGIWLTSSGDVKISFSGALVSALHSMTRNSTEPDLELYFDDVLYYSPEEVRANRSDHSNIFTIGTLLYELISGKNPYAQDSFMKTVLMLVQCKHEELSSLVPSLPEEIEELIDKAMHIAPEQRFKDSTHLLKELRSTLGKISGPTNKIDIAAMVRLLVYEAPASRRLVDTEIERISKIDWLHPDAEVEALNQDSIEWLEARFDEHLSHLQIYAVDQGFPICQTKVTRSFSWAHQIAPKAASTTLPSEVFARLKAIEASQQRVEQLCTLTTKISNAREAAVQRALLAASPKGHTKLLSRWWSEPESSPPAKIIRAHISHLFAFGDLLPSPWAPFIAIWERGLWPVTVSAEGLWLYVPLYRGETMCVEPDATSKLPSSNLQCWLA